MSLPASTWPGALGGGHESGQYIQTIPKRGYRFVADVGTVHAAPRGGEAAVTRPAESLATIVVLKAPVPRGCSTPGA